MMTEPINIDISWADNVFDNTRLNRNTKIFSVFFYRFVGIYGHQVLGIFSQFTICAHLYGNTTRWRESCLQIEYQKIAIKREKQLLKYILKVSIGRNNKLSAYYSLFVYAAASA